MHRIRRPVVPLSVLHRIKTEGIPLHGRCDRWRTRLRVVGRYGMGYPPREFGNLFCVRSNLRLGNSRCAESENCRVGTRCDYRAGNTVYCDYSRALGGIEMGLRKIIKEKGLTKTNGLPWHLGFLGLSGRFGAGLFLLVLALNINYLFAGKL